MLPHMAGFLPRVRMWAAMALTYAWYWAAGPLYSSAPMWRVGPRNHGANSVNTVFMNAVASGLDRSSWSDLPPFWPMDGLNAVNARAWAGASNSGRRVRALAAAASSSASQSARVYAPSAAASPAKAGLSVFSRNAWYAVDQSEGPISLSFRCRWKVLSFSHPIQWMYAVRNFGVKYRRPASSMKPRTA